jgi:hypothetical protein
MTRSAPALYRVGADPGPDTDPRFVLFVPFGVAEIGNHRGDGPGARPFEGVHPERISVNSALGSIPMDWIRKTSFSLTVSSALTKNCHH